MFQESKARDFQIILINGSGIEQASEINSWILGGKMGWEGPVMLKEPG